MVGRLTLGAGVADHAHHVGQDLRNVSLRRCDCESILGCPKIVVPAYIELYICYTVLESYSYCAMGKKECADG